MSTKNNSPWTEKVSHTVLSSDFEINTDSIRGETHVLLNHLQAGNTIHFLQAREMGITLLDKRKVELSELFIPIYSRAIRIGGLQCKEYSLQPFV